MNKEERKQLLEHIGRVQHKIIGTAEAIIDVVAAGLKAPAQGPKSPAHVARRQIANMLRTAQFCPNRTCRRARHCRGEPLHCLTAVIPLLPEQAFDGLLHKRRPRPSRSSNRASLRP